VLGLPLSTFLLRRLDRRLKRAAVPAERRHEILTEVGQGLDEAAVTVGEDEAVRRFGDVDAVAREYADVEHEYGVRRPRYLAGVIWAVAVLLLLFVLQVLRLPTFGLVREFDPQFGGGAWELSLWPLFRFFGDTNAGTLVDTAVGWPSYLVFPALAFVLGSRLWRLQTPR
jgi:hypothetical protein